MMLKYWIEKSLIKLDKSILVSLQIGTFGIKYDFKSWWSF